MPSSPSVTARNALILAIMEKTTSDNCAATQGLSAHFMPALSRGCALARVRLYPVTLCPASSSRLAIRLPMTPNPTKPMFAIGYIRNLNSKSVFRASRLTFRLDIFAHLFQGLGSLIQERGKIFQDLLVRYERHAYFGLFCFGEEIRIFNGLGEGIAQHGDAIRRRTWMHRKSPTNGSRNGFDCHERFSQRASCQVLI